MEGYWDVAGRKEQEHLNAARKPAARVQKVETERKIESDDKS